MRNIETKAIRGSVTTEIPVQNNISKKFTPAFHLLKHTTLPLCPQHGALRKTKQDAVLQTIITDNLDNQETPTNAFTTTAALALLLTSASASAATTYVAPGNGTLQAAINAAAPGDTLQLGDGNYRGALIIKKDLTIEGLNPHASIKPAHVGDFRHSNHTPHPIISIQIPQLPQPPPNKRPLKLWDAISKIPPSRPEN